MFKVVIGFAKYQVPSTKYQILSTGNHDTNSWSLY